MIDTCSETAIPYTAAVPWNVYVLQSKRLRKTYVGIALDTERRLTQHNGETAGGAKATRAGRPWRVGAVYGPFETRGEAQRIERAVKRLSGRRRLQWHPEVS